MSRVFVPYTRFDERVAQALATAGVPAGFWDVSADDEAYWRLLSDLWVQGDGFTIVEQDIVVRADTLASFDRCQNDWCGAGYRYLSSDRYVGLGCTRFRSEFIAAHPDLIEVAGEYSDNAHPQRHWCTLDAAMQFALRDKGLFACSAHGIVEHLGSGQPSHGCC